RRACSSFRLFRAFFENAGHVVLSAFEFLPTLVNRSSRLLQTLKKPHFAFDAAYSRGATTLVHLGNSFLVGKNLVVVEDRANIRVALVRAPDASRVRDHGLQ